VSPMRLLEISTLLTYPANQNMPIWPFIQPVRSVQVLIVNDNSADTDDNRPNGTEIHHTYVQAKEQGLIRMPLVPTIEQYMKANMWKQASFFGCDNKDEVTIIYLPNHNYTFQSYVGSSQFEWTKAEIDGIVANGHKVLTQNDDPEWPTCMKCAVLKKTASVLPSQCNACFTKYCWKG
jgi:lysophospholipase